MKYKVALHESEEGCSVWVPDLPGCCSQGATEEEALANIADAMREYLEVVTEQLDGAEVREIEVEERPSRPEDAFATAADHVLEKNADLYRRLV